MSLVGTVVALMLLACAYVSATGDTHERLPVPGDPPDPGLGPPFSAWYLSLKTSKGYCGLVPAPAAAGGYGFAITCNNKAVQYGSQFTLLLPRSPPARIPEAIARAGEQTDGAWGEEREPDGERDPSFATGEGVELTGTAATSGQYDPAAQAAGAAPLEHERTGNGSGRAAVSTDGSQRGHPRMHRDLDATKAARALLSSSGGDNRLAFGGSIGGNGVIGRAVPLLDDEHDGGPLVLQRAGAGAAAGATAAEAAARAGLYDPAASVIVTSGRTVRLLSRSAGLCNTPPPLPPAVTAAAPPSAPSVPAASAERTHVDESVQRLAAAKIDSGGTPPPEAGLAKAATWLAGAAPALTMHIRNAGRAAGCGLARLLGRTPTPWCVAPLTAAAAGQPGSGNAGKEHAPAARLLQADVAPGNAHAASGASGGGVGLGDAAPRAVVCALAQPSALTFRVYKSDLKEGQDVDLAKEWVYLMEGDKYCTLADVGGLSAAISCHLDSPGWSGYKFQLQPLSYPRTQMRSLLTDSPCGVRLPALPGPHDMECGPGQQAGRAPELELMLQTPGSAFVAGVVVGLSTFSPGLTGSEQQRCCAQTSLPHILLCEPPASGAVPNECWFQLYNVPLSRAATRGIVRSLMGHAAAGSAAGGVGGGGRGWDAFWRAFLRGLATELSPDGLDPEFPDADSGFSAGAAGEAGAAAVVTRHGAGGGGAWGGAWDPDSRPDPQPDLLHMHPQLDDTPLRLLDDDGSGDDTSAAAMGEALAAEADRVIIGVGGAPGLVDGGVDVGADPPFRAAAPLGDGSLVMLTSKAFGRYCSCSLDGTLLCVSAQASNASRNLFTLAMPPLSQRPAPRSARVAAEHLARRPWWEGLRRRLLAGSAGRHAP